MPSLTRIESYAEELKAIRWDIHAHPEIGFEEERTAEVVAKLLTSWGITVHRGIGKTGVVGVLDGKLGAGRSIGLRADMDALPMQETADVPYKSTIDGKFHGCGHDGHTTMLLGAARYLAETRAFAGRVVFIFQPAEEGLGGARAMLAEKLFDQFPCDEIYGLHNSPYLDAGKISIRTGPSMAGADFFDIKIKGHGSHGANPQASKDPIIIANALVQALQTIVSRNTSPLESAVLSVTQIHAGSAYNVIPQEATLAGTIRTFSLEVGDLVRHRMRTIAAGVAASFEVDIEVDIRNIFDVLVNHKTQTEALKQAAFDIVGEENVSTMKNPVMGSEDFADMLRVVPGSYCWVGHSGTLPLHNPGFILGDDILPVGASLLARVVERQLAA